MTTAPSGHRWLGIALAGAGSVFWSTGGIFARLIHLDILTTLMWRSGFAALSLVVVILVRDGSTATAGLRGIGRPGLLAIPISAVAMLGYVAALKLTTVANVMVVYATLPFVAAGIAFLWMGERPEARVLMASGLALVGVVVITGSATRQADLLGNSFALLMTVTFGILLVMARRFPALDMAAVNAGAAVLCAAVCWPFVEHTIPGTQQVLLLAGFGIVCVGLAFLLFLTGGKYIPSSEAGLIGFLDVVLGPLWVWMIFGERPPPLVFVGGACVFAAVIWYLAAETATSSSQKRHAPDLPNRTEDDQSPVA